MTTSKTKILQIGPLNDWADQALQAEYEVLPLWQQTDRAAYLAAEAADCRGLVTSARHGLKGELIEQLSRLEVISSMGVGYDSIDVKTAHARGIQVGNTPDVLNDCVADLAFSLLLACARRIASADRFVRNGNWMTGAFPLTASVTGKRLGIVGLGKVGKTVAHRASGFNMEIRYHNRSAQPDSPHVYENDLIRLAEWSDFLVLTCIGGPSTHHLISAKVLAALGRKGILVNVARGTVVDESALVAALANGSLGGAALDVFEDEPNVPAALMHMENTVLSPHSASGTHETRRRMSELVLHNLRQYFSTGHVATPV